jgi:inorganic pyrophosphatase
MLREMQRRMLSFYSTKRVGEMTYLLEKGKEISPWHSVPLSPLSPFPPEKGNLAHVVNYVVEIPQGTQAKNEIEKGLPFNPIRQEEKKGKKRFLEFRGGVPCNYGFIPQTWEDPAHTVPSDDGLLRFHGDGDPVDVIDVSKERVEVGHVVELRVLGVLGMIDQGECDWKIIGINNADPDAHKLSDLGALQAHAPSLINDVIDWYRLYKVPEGKGENHFLFGGKPKGRDYAVDVIRQAHDAWRLMHKDLSKFGFA